MCNIRHLLLRLRSDAYTVLFHLHVWTALRSSCRTSSAGRDSPAFAWARPFAIIISNSVGVNSSLARGISEKFNSVRGSICAVFAPISVTSYIGIADKIDLQIGADFLSCRGDKPNAAKAMWRIEGAVRAKKMRQDDRTEFIRASYHLAYRIFQYDTILYSAIPAMDVSEMAACNLCKVVDGRNRRGRCRHPVAREIAADVQGNLG